MNPNLRNLTNNFHDVRLVSLASWRQANEIIPRDHGGPYVVLQEGYDPADMRMIAEEFVLGRSGKWLSLGHFFKLPVPERRAEFVFGTAAEVMQIMSDLPTKAVVFAPGDQEQEAATGAQNDDMANALKTARSQKPRAGT